MKKRLISFLLVLVMVLSLIPAMALTANAAGNYIRFGFIKVPAGSYLEQGKSTATTTKPADNYAYYDGTTLELHNYIDTWLVASDGSDLLIRLYGYNYVHGVLCNNANTNMASLCIEGNGTLSIDGCIEAKDLRVNSGNLEITSSGAVFVDMEKVTYPKNSIALCSKNMAEAWESFDFDKVIDKKYRRVMIISSGSFGSQSPAMPEGKTAHDLGTVAALNYPISFRAVVTDVLKSTGCRYYEKLEVKNSAGQTVISKLKEADDRDMPFDMNELPAGQYTIEETVGIIDPDGKKQVTTTHSFYINWQPISPIKYVIAKSTEPIAGTVNTAPTITIAPECHCKVSNYMTGYWLYYTKGLGWRRMEENTKFVADKDYAYYFAIETTDGYTFPADGGNVNGILQCDQGYFGADVNRVEGRDDVAEMMLYYQPCTYGAPLEFSEQTPVVDFTNSALYEMEAVLGEDYLFSFNNKPLTDEQKAKGFTIERTLMVAVGSLTNFVHKVQNDTGTQPLSYNLTIDQAQTYIVTMAIILKKDGTTLQTKGGVYQIKVVAGGTPVIFTADSANSFGGTVTVDIDAMAKKDADLKTALDNGTVKYQWYRGASQIPGADGQSYTFHADDVGKKIKVAVLYGNSGSISEPFEVRGTAPAFTKQPTGGSVAPDKTMTVKWATSFTPTKIVVDKYNFVGLASEYTTLSGTATSIELPANEYGYVIKAYYNEKDFITSDKFTVNEVAFVNPFTDVKKGDFYYDPVLWAVENGITSGATATTFNPGGTCLRAQVVTFLHRAAGSPNPTSTRNPFTDVKSTDFFYKPVLWAVEKNITSGTSATTFGSMQNCNRAAVGTFLWRAAGSPEPKSTKNPFVDVKSTDFFYKSVLWAVENGITAGLDATHFGPTTVCNRAQVVPFLYRVYN